MQHDHILKKWNIDRLTPTPGSEVCVWGGGGGGVCRQNICDHLTAFVIPFNLIMQHDIVLKKVNFDLVIPRVRGGGVGSAGKKFASMLLHFVIPINLISNMTMF